jgi:hypothetical protein
MSFEKLEGSKVRHRDLGYIVQVTGRFGAAYIEGNRAADVEVEFGGPSVIVYASTLKWREDDYPPVEPERAEEILDRILRGFEAMGSYVELDRR